MCAVLFGGHVLIGLSYGSGLLCGTASAGGSNLAGPGAALALGGLGCLWRHLAKDRRSSLKCCAGCVYVVLILLHDFKPLPGMIKPTHSYFSSELKPRTSASAGLPPKKLLAVYVFIGEPSRLTFNVVVWRFSRAIQTKNAHTRPMGLAYVCMFNWFCPVACNRRQTIITIFEKDLY